MKIYIKVYDNDGNIVLMPFDMNDVVPFGDSYKLAETKAEYLSRTKVTLGNYRARSAIRYAGSVRFHTSS